jgi:hypothetical protein
MALITLFETVIGSHAYGTETPESDLDIRGVVIQDDWSYYFGLRRFDTKEYETEEDHVAWSLQKFLHLASKGNTQMLEMLFGLPRLVRVCHPAFQQVLDVKHMFITKQLFAVIQGYATLEHRRALGLSSRELGARRKTDVETMGYSGRNGSHCIRLLYCGAQALSMGVFPVYLPEPERTICRALKLGETPKERYEELFLKYFTALQESFSTCSLPEQMDYDVLNTLLVTVHKALLVP